MGTTNLTNITILEFMSSNLVVCIKACLRHAFLKQNITLLVACVKLTRYQMYIFLEASGFTVCLFWLFLQFCIFSSYLNFESAMVSTSLQVTLFLLRTIIFSSIKPKNDILLFYLSNEYSFFHQMI